MARPSPAAAPDDRHRRSLSWTLRQPRIPGDLTSTSTRAASRSTSLVLGVLAARPGRAADCAVRPGSSARPSACASSASAAPACFLGLGARLDRHQDSAASINLERGRLDVALVGAVLRHRRPASTSAPGRDIDVPDAGRDAARSAVEILIIVAAHGARAGRRHLRLGIEDGEVFIVLPRGRHRLGRRPARHRLRSATSAGLAAEQPATGADSRRSSPPPLPVHPGRPVRQHVVASTS